MSRPNPRNGFSLVELTIVVVILGVLAMIGVPRYRLAVERAVATEAFDYLSKVERVQAIRQARSGDYTRRLGDLALVIEAPRHFKVGSILSSDWEKNWKLKLTRKGPSRGFGAYTVAWNETGYDGRESTIPAELAPAGLRSTTSPIPSKKIEGNVKGDVMKEGKKKEKRDGRKKSQVKKARGKHRKLR